MVNKGSGQEIKKSCLGTCSLAWHSGKVLCFKCQAGMQSCPSLFLPLAIGNASSGIVTSRICKIIVACSGVQLPVPQQIIPHLLAAFRFLLYPLYTLGETWQKVHNHVLKDFSQIFGHSKSLCGASTTYMYMTLSGQGLHWFKARFSPRNTLNILKLFLIVKIFSVRVFLIYTMFISAKSILKLH